MRRAEGPAFKIHAEEVHLRKGPKKEQSERRRTTEENGPFSKNEITVCSSLG